ncbi:MAG: DUF3822 family protein [Bacteroidota bacterium]
MLKLQEDFFAIQQTDISKAGLAIAHSADSFAFSLFDTEQSLYKGLCTYSTDGTGKEKADSTLKAIKEKISNKQTLSEVRISIRTNYFTLIPEIFFDSSQAVKHLELLFNPDEMNLVAQYDYHPAAGIYLVYYSPYNLINQLSSNFGKVQVNHYLTPLLNRIYRKSPADGLNALVLFTENQFLLLIMQNGNIQFCNAFEINTPEDFNYFLLTSFSRYELDQSKATVYFTGKTNKQQEFLDAAKANFPKIVSYIPFPPSAAPDIQAEFHNCYPDLFNLFL